MELKSSFTMAQSNSSFSPKEILVTVQKKKKYLGICKGKFYQEIYVECTH